ncbi:oxidoreductase [Flavihumibacter solisilvae]|uniref:Short-chain dehydrogenase n=1 Tax=Flavihumibacter solisilvae TaxID=1349421 RepID=A0A0C1L1V7_9BACT|nr:oxidoreductase [Flavihumibacter solisilvae]KIC93987.1 short-chain dehydrogenase [Flavihumibacter solisilvae]
MKQNQVWFVTGASKGFGFEITKAALKAGHKVVATVRSNPGRLSSQFNSKDLFVVVLDVTKEGQVKDGVKQAIDQFGRIDVLVNNAGFGLLGAIEEISDSEAKRQFDTNVFGLLNVTRAVLPFMRKERLGHIINISSVLGYATLFPGLAIYSATKFAVEGISEGLSLELEPFGISVTAVAPGLFRTDFTSSDSYQNAEAELEAYKDTVGLRRVAVKDLHGNQPGDPAKLASVVVQIASGDHPPRHLPIGRDSVAAIRAKYNSTAKEVDEWEELSSSTDHAVVA